MSLRISTTSWIPGALVIGNTGLGVLGSAIPATGDNGPGYAYNDLSLPTDNDKEICGRITTWPTNGTLIAYEDTSFTYTGTSDSFSYQLYVDGVATGSPTSVGLAIGGAGTATGAIAPIGLTAPTATAVGDAGVAGNAAGTLAAISLTAPTATATGGGNAYASIRGITLTAPTGSATGDYVAQVAGAMAGGARSARIQTSTRAAR